MRRLAALLVSFCLCLACDDGGEGAEMEAPEEDAGAEAPEHDPPEGDVYVAGLTHMGAEEALQVELTRADPAPPDRGMNHWEIRVSTVAGEPQSGCEVVVEPDMPAHGHGTDAVSISEMDAAGMYRVADMNLFMPGLWVIPIELTCGELTDTVTFEFWMRG